MFFKESKAETCVVYGETLTANESRLVEKDLTSGVTFHRHMRCNPTAGSAPVPVRATPSLPRVASAAVPPK